MFDKKMAQDSIKFSQQQDDEEGGVDYKVEPDTEKTVSKQENANKLASATDPDDFEFDATDSVNIKVGSTSQFGQEEPKEVNEDLQDIGEEQSRPKTAPETNGGMTGDWPASNKDDLITRMSQQVMKAATDENLLVRQYQQKKNIGNAVKAAN